MNGLFRHCTFFASAQLLLSLPFVAVSWSQNSTRCELSGPQKSTDNDDCQKLSLFVNWTRPVNSSQNSDVVNEELIYDYT